jgi:hypothetical protein
MRDELEKSKRLEKSFRIDSSTNYGKRTETNLANQAAYKNISRQNL